MALTGEGSFQLAASELTLGLTFVRFSLTIVATWMFTD